MAYVSTPLEIFNSQMDHMTKRYMDALELGRQYTYIIPVFKNIATCSFIVPQLGKACWLNTHLNSQACTQDVLGCSVNRAKYIALESVLLSSE